eukprot:283726-Chlamydomonas_euryale.AAC.1
MSSWHADRLLFNWGDAGPECMYACMFPVWASLPACQPSQPASFAGSVSQTALMASSPYNCHTSAGMAVTRAAGNNSSLRHS